VAVTSDPDIFRAAKLLLDQHGEDAPCGLPRGPIGFSTRATSKAPWSGTGSWQP